MSYMLDLDEYDEARLLNELIHRMEQRNNGCCDYCGMSLGLRYSVTDGNGEEVRRKGCRMYDRHDGKLADNVPELQARLLRLIEEALSNG